MDVPKEYELANDLLEKESDRYWSRCNVMLIIQGALLALLGGTLGKPQPIVVAVAALGLVFAVLWYGVVAKGVAYLRRWAQVVMTIEAELKKQNKDNFYAIRHMQDSMRVDEKTNFVTKHSTTSLMRIAATFVVIFWAAVLVGALVGAWGGEAAPTVHAGCRCG